MERQIIQRKFESMGARVRFQDLASHRFQVLRELPDKVEVDVLRDKKGQFFNISYYGNVDLVVPDVQKADRHLLLMARLGNGKNVNEQILKMLCGHDEREWFAAQVPHNRVSNVGSAKEALKPRLAVVAQKKNNVKPKDRHRRKNKGYIRQGEWFFIPAGGVDPDQRLVTRREPIVLAGTRAGNKPHIAEEAYQEGGQLVYVHVRYAPQGMALEAQKKLFRRDPKAARSKNWRVMTRNPRLYVRGAVRHPDHKTIQLRGWHQVFLNREKRGNAVAFLD